MLVIENLPWGVLRLQSAGLQSEAHGLSSKIVRLQRGSIYTKDNTSMSMQNGKMSRHRKIILQIELRRRRL